MIIILCIISFVCGLVVMACTMFLLRLLIRLRLKSPLVAMIVLFAAAVVLAMLHNMFLVSSDFVLAQVLSFAAGAICFGVLFSYGCLIQRRGSDVDGH